MPTQEVPKELYIRLLQEIEIFNRLPSPVIEKLALHMTLERYDKNSIVNQRNDSIYFVLKGSIKVHDDQYTVEEYKTGDFFIRLLPLSSEMKPLAMSALEQTFLSVIHRPADFYDAMKKYPDTINDLVTTLTKRLHSQYAIIIKHTRELDEQLNEFERERLEKEKTEFEAKFMMEFVANMSHEIRMPLNGMIGVTNLILKTTLTEQQRKYLNVIAMSSGNLSQITNDILDLYKIANGKMVFEKVPFSLKDVIQEIFDLMCFRAEEKNLDFTYAIMEGVPEYILGDSLRLKQILINLIGNAIKFTEEGYIKLNILVEAKNENLSVINLKFLVEDTGIGITKEQQENIFDGFVYSDTHQKYGGTGLGLQIVKGFIELLGGVIEFQSEFKKGSKFIFTIPYSVSSLEQYEKFHRTLSPTISKEIELLLEEKKELNVLVVDDNQFNQMVATDILKEYIKKIKVDVAENGIIAIDRLKNNNFDIILMDTLMPDLDGYETTKRIRLLSDSKSKVNIIGMTVNISKEEISKCFKAGMNACVSKPLDTEKLLSKIIKLIKGNNNSTNA